MWNLLVDTDQLSIMLSLMRTVTEAETVFFTSVKTTVAVAEAPHKKWTVFVSPSAFTDVNISPITSSWSSFDCCRSQLRKSMGGESEKGYLHSPSEAALSLLIIGFQSLVIPRRYHWFQSPVIPRCHWFQSLVIPRRYHWFQDGSRGIFSEAALSLLFVIALSPRCHWFHWGYWGISELFW